MKTENLGLLAAIVAAFFFGMGNPFAKLVAESLDPLLITTFAAFVASVAFAIVSIGVNSGFPKLDSKDALLYLGIGILGFAIPAVLSLIAMQMTGALSVLFLLRTEVFFNTVFGVVLFKEKITHHQIVGILVGFVGVFIFATGLKFDGINPGDLLTLVATLFWASYVVFARKLTEKLDVYTIGGMRYWIALPFLVAAMLLLGKDFAIPAANYFNLFAFTFSTYVLGLIAYNIAIKKIGIWKAAVPQLLSVFFGSIFTMLLLTENLSYVKWFGAILIIGGTFYALEEKKKK